MAPKRQMKKAKRAPRRAKKLPISRGLGGVPDVASLTEVISIRAPNAAQYFSNQSYRLYNMSLALLPRASLVAQAYQEFRIRRITVVYKANLDTFTAATNSIPQMYYMVDKKGAVPSNFTVDTLQQMGSIPRRFDDKTLTVRYTPAVLQSSLTDPTALSVGVAAAQLKPWLPTNNSPNATTFTPSDVDHFGLSWQALTTGGSSVIGYDIDIMVDVEFRRPRWNSPAPSVPKALDWNFKSEVLGE